MQVWIARMKVLWPGVMMAIVVAVAAMFLSDHYGAPVMLFALMLGMVVNFLSQEGRCVAGIEFTARQVLRWGVALLGLKITAAQVQAMGWQPVALVVMTVAATITFGIVMAKVMGFKPFFGLLSGGAVGICGASAAMAIAAAFPHHPQRDRATLFTVVSVSTLSTVAMVLYPVLVLAAWMTHRLHAQSRAAPAAAGQAHAPRPPLLPGFAVVFVGLVMVNSLDIFPQWAVEGGNELSRAFLVGAMASIGMKTHIKDILSVGWKPVALVMLETTFLAVIFFGLMRLLAV